MVKRFVLLVLLFLMALMFAIAPASLAKLPAADLMPPSSNPAETVERSRSLYEAGEYEQATALLRQAIQTYQTQGDDLRRAIALSNLALLYQQLGNWTAANSTIQISLDLLAAPADSQHLSAQAQALDIQGRLQLAQGQTEPALTSWQQAAERYQQLGDTDRLVRSQIDQSRALQRLGLYRRSIGLLSELNQILQTQPDSLVKAAGLRSLGDALRVTSDNLEQSRQRLQDSLEVAQRLQPSAQVQEAIALAYLSLGNTSRAQAAAQLASGNRAEAETTAALRFYQQAAAGSASTQIQARLNRLSLFVERQQWEAVQLLLPQVQQQLDGLPLSQTSVYARINLAHSLMQAIGVLEQDTVPIAAQLLTTAVQQAEQLQDLRATAYALGMQGSLYEQTQQWTLAKNFTQQALWQIGTSFTATDIAYLWQWQLGRILKAQAQQGIDVVQNQQGAIAAYELALNTLQSLRQDLVAINPNEQFLFRESVEPAYRQLIELLLSPADGTTDQKNLRMARTTLEALQAVELENFFRQACLDVPIEIDRVIEQSSALAADPANALAAVLYPIILPDRLEVVLKLPNQSDLLQYSTPIPEATVRETLANLRQQMTQPETEATVQILSKQVYDWLIRPAEADLQANQIRTLVFVLDGALKNIPMAALYDGAQYLVENYSIALTPGLKLPDPKPIDRRRVSLLFAGLSEAVAPFEALPGVETEKAGILAAVPDATVLLNQDFTAAALQTQVEEKPFQIVHLATHGVFSSDRNKTFIQAIDRAINIDELNTILQRREQTRPDPIELLVLSACQTAEGDEQAALGLAGVAVRAGARSTLASLWILDDETSAYLMIEFYRQLIDHPNLSKSVALQNAQRLVLQIPGRSHPSFWAPYLLLGNWL